ncbi:MAG TPA: amidohydrolase family protein [Patescibacteria group bacterium]|nr:amidohydrolase family protein [Patescibacteria group bacterium]
MPAFVPTRRSVRPAAHASVATALLAAAVAAALSASSACRSTPPEAAEIILTGGAIRPHPDEPPAGALAIRGGRVLSIGDEGSVLRHRGPATRLIDLAGAVVIPGLGDARARPIVLGETLLNDAAGGASFLDLGDAQSEEDIVQRVRARSRVTGPGEWILGAGWNESRWVAAHPPDKRLLSDIVGSNPALLVHADGDPVWVNAKALDAAGIDGRTPDPPGGRIARERIGGAPTGVLWGRAAELVLRHVPRPSLEDREAAILQGLKGDAALGVTVASVIATGGRLGIEDRSAPPEDVLGPWRDLAGRGRLPLRVSLLVPAPSAAAEALLTGGPEIGLGNGRLDIAALMFDAPPEGGRADLEAMLRRARARGLGVAIAARGSQAARDALAALAATRGDFGQAASPRPVERLDLEGPFDPADLHDLGPDGMLILPSPAAETAVAPLAQALGAGIELALAGEGPGGAWSPIATLEMIAGAWPRERGAPEDLGRHLALRLLTINPARAARRLDEIGILREGSRADFVILSRDPLAAPSTGAGPLKVLATWLDGKEIFPGARR